MKGRSLLTEVESKEVLAVYGIPVAETRLATNAEEAVAVAAGLGYPVVVKLHSHTITYKTDVGGVQLNLPDAEAVRQAYRSIQAAVREQRGIEHFDGVSVQPMINYAGYEVIIGSSTDPQFGPVLVFGLGGQLVEVLRDCALGLPPLNATLARRMVEQTPIYEALKGVRGRQPVDLAALEQLLVRFSQLVVEQPRIKEVDVNPLLASPQQLIALDARIVLHDPALTEDELPRPAIRPYPQQYVSSWQTRDGVPLTIRPIQPEDEPPMVRFHQTLSEETVHARYFSYLQLVERTAHERLTRVCFIDYDRVMALAPSTPIQRRGRGRSSPWGTPQLRQLRCRVRPTAENEFGARSPRREAEYSGTYAMLPSDHSHGTRTPSRAGTSVQTLTASLSFTSVTPGTDQAAFSTSFRSLQLCTFPLSVTLPSWV